MHTSQKRPYTSHHVRRALLVQRAHGKRDIMNKHVKEGSQACTKNETRITHSKRKSPDLRRRHLYHSIVAKAVLAPHRQSRLDSVFVQSLREGEHYAHC